MTRVRRSRTKGSAKDQQKGQKTKRYSRDIDQILADTADGGGKRQRLEKGHVDEPEEITGGGLFPCVACDRHFIDKEALDGHLKNKLHRRRMKQINEGFVSPRDAELAMGRGVDNKQRPPKPAAPAEVEMTAA